MAFTRRFSARRRHPQGVADLLPYDTFLAPGVVLNKDGSFLAAFRFRGPDIDSHTVEQTDVLSYHLSEALRLGDNFLLHVDAIRRPHTAYPNSHFPHPVLSLIDEERRGRFTSGSTHETTYFLAVTHQPNAARDRLFATLFSSSSGQPDLDEALSLYEHRLQELEDNLSALRPVRLTDSSLASYLHLCVSGLDHPVAWPNVSYLDLLLADQPLIGGVKPRIGDLHLAPITLTGLPDATFPAFLRSLDSLPFSFRWNTRVHTLDGATAGNIIQKIRLRWSQARTPFFSYLISALKKEEEGKESATARNPHAEAMVIDAHSAMTDARSGAEAFGFWTTTLLLSHEDPAVLETNSREALKTLRAQGIPCRLEGLNAVEAFLGSLPGNGVANLRKYLIKLKNFSHLAPFTATYTGAPHCPNDLIGLDQPALLYTRSSTGDPMRLNTYVGDVGHSLLVGPTGAGKTTLLTTLTAQFFRYHGARVFAFDRGFGLYPLVTATGGSHYDLGNPGTSLYPLAKLDSAGFAWAAAFLEILFTMNGVSITPDHRSALSQALTLLSSAPPNSRTLEHLRLKLQHPDLRQALVPYTGDGPFASILDSDRDTLDPDSRFHVFELTSLLAFGPNVVVPTILTIFNKIEDLLDGSPTLILLEEAWELLGRSLFADRIAAWLKTLRKKNASVIFVTQSLGDLDNSPIKWILYESCPTRILLANPDALTPNGRAAYEAMGLNHRQIEIVGQAKPKRQYYLASPEGSRLFELDLGPLQLSFFAAGSSDDLNAIRALQSERGSLWPVAWLRSRGLHAQADQIHARLLEAP